MADNDLWTERLGGTLKLTSDGFATLLVDAFRGLRDDGYFAQNLEWGGPRWVPLGGADANVSKAFFAMKLGDPWPSDEIFNVILLGLRPDDHVFDLIELLHRDVVSRPLEDPPTGKFDQALGQQDFRSRVNPILARRDPSFELLANGQIVQAVAEPFRRLVGQSLPVTAPKREVAARVEDAVRHFRRRGATSGDRRAAVRELADVLEFLREDVKKHLPSEDERAMFRLANEFAIRHNKRDTRRDFDEPAWLAWAFYVYLATIRLTLTLRERDGSEKSASSQ
jgi:hypothetical protein